MAAMKTALLIVDIQNDYFPGGAMEVVGARAAAAQAAKLLGAFREQGRPVIHLQHISQRAGATFFLPGTSGAEIHEAVKPTESEPVFQKHFPSGFRETPLLEHLRGEDIASLVIAGMMTRSEERRVGKECRSRG